MNRGNLLTMTRKFLEANNLREGICEVRIPVQRRYGNFPPIERERILVMTGVTEPLDVINYCQYHDLVLDIDPYTDLSEYENNESYIRVDTQLVFNWRGRVLRFDEDFDFNMTHDNFDKTFLKSYWRFVLTEREGHYYGSHDLTPMFYHPGTSAIGMTDPLPSIHSFLRFIYWDYATLGVGKFDPNYDYVVLFGKGGAERTFRKFALGHGDQRKEEWTHREFCDLIQQVGFDNLAEQILNSIV